MEGQAIINFNRTTTNGRGSPTRHGHNRTVELAPRIFIPRADRASMIFTLATRRGSFRRLPCRELAAGDERGPSDFFGFDKVTLQQGPTYVGDPPVIDSGLMRPDGAFRFFSAVKAHSSASGAPLICRCRRPNGQSWARPTYFGHGTYQFTDPPTHTKGIGFTS